MFDYKRVIQEAYTLLSDKMVLSEDNDIFAGSIYKNKTKVKGGRLKRNIFDFRKHLTSAIDKLRPLFIIGYNLEESHLFFEIWYLPFDGQYIIVDKFGKRTIRFEKYETITAAIDKLIDIVSTIDPDNYEEYEDLDDDFRINAEKNVRSRYKVSTKDLDRDTYYDDGESITQEDINVLLEANVASRALLADMINSNIEEYKSTRMDHAKINRLWRFLLGRDIVRPSKYLGGIVNAVLKLVGRGREASFVVGYSLDNKINFEIWYVKSASNPRGSFYVFDVTSSKILDKDLPNMRQAYARIANKITTKV